MRHRVDPLLIVGEPDGGNRLATRAGRRACGRRSRRRSRAASPAGRTPAAESSRISGSSTGLSDFGSPIPHTPRSIASPGAQARNSSGFILPCMTGSASRWPSRWSRRSSGQMRNSSGRDANPETMAPFCRRRKSSPCAAAASPARATASAPSPARHALIRPRSAFFSSTMSVRSFTAGGIEPNRAGRCKPPARDGRRPA